MNPLQNSKNFDDERSFSDVLADRIMHDLKVCIPVKVISINTAKRTCNVATLNQEVLNYYGTTQPIQINDIPIITYGSQGAYFSLPIAINSTGFLLVSDIDLINFKNSDHTSTVSPLTKRMHDLNDGIFLPCQFATTSVPIDNTLTMYFNDSNYLTLSASGLNIVASKVTHGGIDIGNSHYHAQSPDSAGNTEQDTSTPK